MTNLEHYKDELKEVIALRFVMENSISDDIGYGFRDFAIDHYKEWITDDKISGSFVDWLLEEYKEKIELKQWEFDLLSDYNGSMEFYGCYTLQNMSNKGYFKGVTDMDMTTQEILENCEVIDD